MKIALVVPSIAFDGEIETPAVRVFAQEIGSVVELHVFPIFLPAGGAAQRIGNLTVHPAETGSSRFARRLTRTLAAIRREHLRSPFDVVHALWLHEPGTVAVAAGALHRLPVVASVGGAEVVSLPDIAYGALRDLRGRLATALVLQRATIVTGGSRYAVRRARRVVPHRDPNRFRRAPLPVSAEAFARGRDRPLDAAAPRLLHVGSIVPVKDQTTLLQAFRRVVNALPGARLTIAGADPFGYRAELERLTATLCLSDAVTFVGALPHNDIAELYSDTDLLVMSSLHESQGMVALEAAAAGVPTVGTRVGIVPDLAPDAAFAVRPGDPGALGEAIIGVLRDPITLARLGALARQRVLDEYDAPIVRHTFLSIYEEAIGIARR